MTEGTEPKPRSVGPSLLPALLALALAGASCLPFSPPMERSLSPGSSISDTDRDFFSDPQWIRTFERTFEYTTTPLLFRAEPATSGAITRASGETCRYRVRLPAGLAGSTGFMGIFGSAGFNEAYGAALDAGANSTGSREGVLTDVRADVHVLRVLHLFTRQCLRINGWYIPPAQ